MGQYQSDMQIDKGEDIRPSINDASFGSSFAAAHRKQYV